MLATSVWRSLRENFSAMRFGTAKVERLQRPAEKTLDRNRKGGEREGGKKSKHLCVGRGYPSPSTQKVTSGTSKRVTADV